MATHKLNAIEKRLGNCSLESFAKVFAPFWGLQGACKRIRQQVFVLACEKNRSDILEFIREGNNTPAKQHDKAMKLPVDQGLMSAIKGHNFDTVSYLVETFRPDLNLPRRESTTPLLAAIKESQVSIARFLMEHGADISEAKDEYNSSLHYACCHIRGSLEMLQLLLSMGAPVDAVNYMGYTALHMSCMAGRHDMAECLLRYGTSVNKEAPGGRTPLVLACHSNNVAIVRLLLEHNSVQSLTSPWNKTECGYPVEIAVRTGRLSILKEMLKCDVRPTNHRLDGSRTLVHVAADNAQDNILDWLVTEQGYDPNARDANDKTPMHVLCSSTLGWMDERKDVECIRILAKAGAILDPFDMDGSAPIHYAVQRLDVKVLKTLLDVGASTNTLDRNGQTAVLLVCSLAKTCATTSRTTHGTNHHQRNCRSETIYDELGLLLCRHHDADASTMADQDSNVAFIVAAECGIMDSTSFEMLRMAAHRGFFETPKKEQNQLYTSRPSTTRTSCVMRPTKRPRTN